LTDAGSSEELRNIMQLYDEADSFIYTDFCLSATTKLTLTRLTKNLSMGGRDELSDSYAKCYSPAEHIAA
jgi:hypothetical protein